jgi:rSAM/selenodomain-associated transferase 2
MRLAIILPVLNEAVTVAAALARLADLRSRGASVIVVDGGSDDATVERAAAADCLISAPRGRALQMNAGARTPPARSADALVFLHADTRLPPQADRLIERALQAAPWGRFDVTIAADSARNRLPLRAVATLMNLRSRLSGIATGDQAIFVRRAAFEALGGFAPLPLMEDIDFSRRARRLGWPAALRTRAITSGRRWERDGVLRTILLMWRLRAAYFLGADSARLAARYRDAR